MFAYIKGILEEKSSNYVVVETTGIKLVYDVYDKLPFKKNIIFALQQFLAVIAATILVPVLVNSATSTEYLNQASALVGAGMGTIVYLLFTRFKSPVFLGCPFCISLFSGAVVGQPVIGAVQCALQISPALESGKQCQTVEYLL